MTEEFWARAQKEYEQSLINSRAKFMAQNALLRDEFESCYPGLKCVLPEEEFLQPTIQFNFMEIKIYAWRAYDYTSGGTVRKVGWYLCAFGGTDQEFIVPPHIGELYQRCLRLYNKMRGN